MSDPSGATNGTWDPEDDPEKPEGARVQYPDGRVVPLDLIYTGRSEGLNVWTATHTITPGATVHVHKLPPLTTISVTVTTDPEIAAHETQIGRMLRATDPLVARRGEWGMITGVLKHGAMGVVCFRVKYADGVSDLLPVNDPDAGHDFRDAFPADLAGCIRRQDCPATVHHPDCQRGARA